MIRTLLALTTGSAIGLGLMFQEEQEVKEVQEGQEGVYEVVIQDGEAIEDEIAIVLAEQEGEVEEIQEGESTKRWIELKKKLGDENNAVVIVEMATNLADLAAQEAQAAQLYGPNHPKLKQLKEQIQHLSEIMEELGAEDVESLAGKAKELKQVRLKELKELQALGQVQDRLLRIQPKGNMGFSFSGPRPSVVVRGTPFESGTSAFSWRTSGSGFDEYRGRWSEADDAERDEIREEVRTKMAEKFDAELSSRKEYLDEIEKRCQRLRELLQRREENRDSFLQNKMDELELQWEDINTGGKVLPGLLLNGAPALHGKVGSTDAAAGFLMQLEALDALEGAVEAPEPPHPPVPGEGRTGEGRIRVERVRKK